MAQTAILSNFSSAVISHFWRCQTISSLPRHALWFCLHSICISINLIQRRATYCTQFNLIQLKSLQSLKLITLIDLKPARRARSDEKAHKKIDRNSDLLYDGHSPFKTASECFTSTDLSKAAQISQRQFREADTCSFTTFLFSLRVKLKRCWHWFFTRSILKYPTTKGWRWEILNLSRLDIYFANWHDLISSGFDSVNFEIPVQWWNIFFNW